MRIAIASLAILFVAPACHMPANPHYGPGKQDPRMEVVELILLSTQMSVERKDVYRAKALAIQAIALSSGRPRLEAAAQLSAGLAAWARGDEPAMLRYVGRVLEALPITPARTALAMAAAARWRGLGQRALAIHLLSAYRRRAATAHDQRALAVLAVAKHHEIADPTPDPNGASVLLDYPIITDRP